MTESTTPTPSPSAPQQPIDSEKLRNDLLDMLKKAGSKAPQQPSSEEGSKSSSAG